LLYLNTDFSHVKNFFQNFLLKTAIDHNLKADCQILIIFGTTIPDTTCHQRIIQVFTLLYICFCTTWRNQNTWNRH